MEVGGCGLGGGVGVGGGGRLGGVRRLAAGTKARGWTLDLMRRRPDSTYGVIEALIVRSVEEARSRGIVELSLGMTPRVISSGEARGPERALRAVYWGLDRFQRSRMLHDYKEKFGPRWEE